VRRSTLSRTLACRRAPELRKLRVIRPRACSYIQAGRLIRLGAILPVADMQENRAGELAVFDRITRNRRQLGQAMSIFARSSGFAITPPRPGPALNRFSSIPRFTLRDLIPGHLLIPYLPGPIHRTTAPVVSQRRLEWIACSQSVGQHVSRRTWASAAVLGNRPTLFAIINVYRRPAGWPLRSDCRRRLFPANAE